MWRKISHQEAVMMAKSLDPDDFQVIERLIELFFDASISLNGETIGSALATLSPKRFEVAAAVIDRLHDLKLAEAGDAYDRYASALRVIGAHAKALHIVMNGNNAAIVSAVSAGAEWVKTCHPDELRSLLSGVLEAKDERN